MLYKQLFKLNSDGKTAQQWEMHCSDDFTSFWTVSGQVNGKKITNKPTIVTPKVKRNQEEQCKLEMDSKIKQKKDKKYVENIDDIKKADGQLDGFSAMLAKDYDKHKKKLVFPCAVQPKLDGVRCLATKDGLFTRSRKRIEACEHIEKELESLFERFPDLMLDGELYNHEYKDQFEKIVSIVRKTKEKITDEDLRLQQDIQYHIYDVVSPDGFKKRFDSLVPFVESYIKPTFLRYVKTEMVENEDDIFSFSEKMVSEGYEGTMVRNIHSPYEGKRTHNLLKLKTFKDAEFEIVEIIEGKGNLKEHAASFICKLENNKAFKAKLMGSFSRLKEIWKHPDMVLGKMATVQYQNLTRDGVPRFPVVKSVRGLKNKSDWV